MSIGVLMLLPEMRISSVRRRWGVISVLAVIFGLSALALYEDRDLKAKPQYEAVLAVRAARNYQTECAGCHGASGKGDGPDVSKIDTLPEDFTRAGFWNDRTPARIIDVTTTGEGPDMPAFGDRLSAEEILALARHIEANFRPRPGLSH